MYLLLKKSVQLKYHFQRLKKELFTGVDLIYLHYKLSLIRHNAENLVLH